MNQKRLFTALLCLLMPALCMAIGWNEQKYQEIEKSIQQPLFGKATMLITKFGAKPEATAADNQKAIQKAIDKCSKKGGGRVVVPKGMTFQTGAICLKSHVNLVIE